MTNTLYVSRRLGLSPPEAALATDLLHEQLSDAATGPRKRLAANGLRFGRSGASRVPDLRLLRRHRASIRVFGRWVPVELELLRWSSELSELGLRPCGTWWPVGTRRYFDAASGAIDDISKRLIAWNSDSRCRQRSQVAGLGSRSIEIEAKSVLSGSC